jgi:hypothetical protein
MRKTIRKRLRRSNVASTATGTESWDPASETRAPPFRSGRVGDGAGMANTQVSKAYHVRPGVGALASALPAKAPSVHRSALELRCVPTSMRARTRGTRVRRYGNIETKWTKHFTRASSWKRGRAEEGRKEIGDSPCNPLPLLLHPSRSCGPKSEAKQRLVRCRMIIPEATKRAQQLSQTSSQGMADKETKLRPRARILLLSPPRASSPSGLHHQRMPPRTAQLWNGNGRRGMQRA